MTSAVKLNRRPPLTTLETRLIVTTRSRKLLLSPSRSRPPRPPPSRRPRLSRESRPSDRDSRPSAGPDVWPAVPAGCSAIMRSFRSGLIPQDRCLPSEFQPTFTGSVGQCRDPPAVGVAATVEHHRVDAGGLGALGDQLTDPHAVGLLVAVHATHVRLDRRGSGHGGAGEVVDQLHVDVPRRAVHHQARTLRGARDLLPQPRVTTQPLLATKGGHALPQRLLRGATSLCLRHDYLPVFPTLRRICSPS